MEMKKLLIILILVLTVSTGFAYDITLAISRPNYNALTTADKQYAKSFFKALTGNKNPFNVTWSFRHEITHVDWCVINFGGNAFALGGMSNAKVQKFKDWAESKKLYIRKGNAIQWLASTKIEGKPLPE